MSLAALQSTDAFGAPPLDGAGVKALVSEVVNFVGVSAYAPYSGPAFWTQEFENSAFNLGDSLRSLANGMELAALVRAGKIELHYSEFGLGGGQDGNRQPAPSVYLCARQPWAGVAGPYDPAMEPWKRSDLAAFRRDFYSKLLEWLNRPDATTYHVSEVFVWSMASWDVPGVYQESSSNAGSYRDNVLVGGFEHHNRAIMRAKVCAHRSPAECKALTEAPKGQDHRQPPAAGNSSATINP